MSNITRTFPLSLRNSNSHLSSQSPRKTQEIRTHLMLAVCTATNCEIEQLWKAIDSVSPASESLNFSASPEQWSEEKFTDALSLYTPGIA